MKYVSPSVKETAFNCPHCGALAKQFWSSLYAKHNTEKSPLPLLLEKDAQNDFLEIGDPEQREETVRIFKLLAKRLPFMEPSEGTLYGDKEIYNCFVSRCFNCNDIAIWIGDSLVYPGTGEAPEPNADLPSEIGRDYREASSILHLSPRGAAALMRLAIQKLCKHLGQPGQNINADIKALVSAGLDVRVQKALDAVRVIGNSAVHPGSIDISDDRPTAESLFRLINLIADKMISEPKHVDEVYAMLPPGALKQIEERDKGKS
ncbi:DUF4145 domain-containing protein [Neorhizobium sp. LjRoot104]|uniref:DUF4145 domain-containing protein n=1 Tax=Neorhizobium sp. LjRoot104 TaxID=3342254 RepID=UPI003ECCE2BF